MKVFTFDNLVTPTCRVFPSLSEAVNTGISATRDVAPAIRAKTKNERRDWFKQQGATWPCISTTEGVNPALRISTDNPPQYLHGFIADYDAVGKRYTESELTEIASRCTYPPVAGGPSLSGDGVHLVWQFEEPIPVLGNVEYARKVTTECYRSLRVANFLQGFDIAFKLPDRLLSIDPHSFGFLTNQGEAQSVDKVSTRMWASSVTQDFEFDGPSLDLPQVYEHVQRLFPGRWNGDFNVGSRGPRFWDSSASDNTAALVTTTGMVYFTNGGGFRSWSSILGNDVVSKLNAESLGKVTSNWFYDSTNHDYVYHINQKYETKNRTQYMDRLELAGLEDDLERKRAITYTEDHNGVMAVVSLANQKKGVLKQNGLTYLNSTKTHPVRPTQGNCDFICGLLNAMFGEEQVHYFLAWLSDSVRCALSEKPSYAQSVFLCGDVACGKSLLQYRILNPLLGGHYADPMDFLLGASGFNSELADAGHWLSSDAEGGKNSAERASFTQRIKAIAANPCMSVHQKFKTPVTLFLNSRLTFSFNATSESLAILPRLGTDVLDKLCLFSVKTHDYLASLTRGVIEANVEQEIPAFAHWLLNEYQPPKEVLSLGRYPTKSYHSPELMHMARASQDSSELLGWISTIFDQNENFKQKLVDKQTVEYSAATWLQIIQQTLGHHYGLSPRKLSAHFQSLCKQFPNSVTGRIDPSTKVYMFKVFYHKLIEQ